MSLDAMKQALEALELWEENLGNYKNHEWPISIRDGVITITFIPPVRKFGGGRRIELQSAERVELSQKHKFAKESLRAAIKEAEKQEPVGWFGYDEKINTWFETNEGEDDSVPLYAGARGWKGLTLEETVGIELSLRQYHDGDRYDLSLSDFARAIEAKLKEKNT